MLTLVSRCSGESATGLTEVSFLLPRPQQHPYNIASFLNENFCRDVCGPRMQSVIAHEVSFNLQAPLYTLSLFSLDRGCWRDCYFSDASFCGKKLVSSADKKYC